MGVGWGAILRMAPRALCMWNNCSTTELPPKQTESFEVHSSIVHYLHFKWPRVPCSETYDRYKSIIHLLKYPHVFLNVVLPIMSSCSISKLPSAFAIVKLTHFCQSDGYEIGLLCLNSFSLIIHKMFSFCRNPNCNLGMCPMGLFILFLLLYKIYIFYILFLVD